MLQNTLFAEDAEEDLEHFLKSDKRKRVLVFPPVNNYRRFLIHQLVQDRYGDLLQTFSIGQGFARRTVVCYKSDYIGPSKVNGESSNSNESFGGKPFTMGIESQCTPTASPEHSNKPRQVKAAPAYEIYRPPAARRAMLEKSPVAPSSVEQKTPDVTRTNRQKRPDRAVYVPRHRRSATDTEINNVQIQETRSKLPKETRNTRTKPMITKSTNDHATVSDIPETVIAEVEKVVDDVVQRDAQVELIPLIEKTDKQIIPEPPTLANESLIDKMEGVQSPNVSMIEEPLEEGRSEIVPTCQNKTDERDRRKDSEDFSMKNETESQAIENLESLNKTEVSNTETTKIELNTRKHEQSKNEKNEKPIRQALVSKVLIISTNNEEKEEKNKSPVISPVAIPMTPPEKKVKKIERPKSKPAPPPAPPLKINRDECDWDSLFDDNGDCLDPTLIEELTTSVGEVTIEKPKSNYKSVTRPIEVSNDEFGHVVEIYNFPCDFKSSDLAAAFSPFKAGGFELKWVDDTHCLGVFSSPLVAAEVLASDHPFVKTRPLSEATALSKTKARKSSEFLQPYRDRPQTCAALARRLVTKSLGVTLATARQEREQEKILLREAKEKRRLENKQREEIWEGIITENK